MLIISEAAKNLPRPGDDVPYTRFYLKCPTATVDFVITDEPGFQVTVITTSWMKGWRYPMTRISAVTREEAREIWKNAIKQHGYEQDTPYRQPRFGAIPAKAAA